MKIFIGLVLIIFLFSSCDPIYHLTVTNVSNKEKQIQGVVPKSYLKEELDSIRIFRAKSEGPCELIKAIAVQMKDTTNSYFFVLPPGQIAVVESGLGVRPHTGQLIIDNVDTVLVSTRKGRIIKKA